MPYARVTHPAVNQRTHPAVGRDDPGAPVQELPTAYRLPPMSLRNQCAHWLWQSRAGTIDCAQIYSSVQTIGTQSISESYTYNNPATDGENADGSLKQ